MDWFFKRQKAKAHMRHVSKSEWKIRNSMNSEQRKIFDLVVQITTDYPESILYDKITEETMITREHLLISMLNDVVHIDNTTGFHPERLPKSAYLLLLHIVDKNAHRYRRGLKYQTKLNLLSFLDKTSEEHKK